MGEAKIHSAEKAAESIVQDAKREAESIQREARVELKDEMHQLRTQAEAEIKERRQELVQLENRLLSREEGLDDMQKDLARREQSVTDREAHYRKVLEEAEAARAEQQKQLEQISGMTRDQASEIILKRTEDEVRHDMAKMVRAIEEEAKHEGERRARDILSTCIQRNAASHVADTTVSVVPLPSDDMKGRIIGREGRNIRTLENLTGIDFIIDDTPEAVVLSGFDTVRREIARLTLSKLVADGRIHPAKIEEMYTKARDEVDKEIQDAGEQAVLDANVHGVAPELHPPSRPAEVPHQLRPERAHALPGSGAPGRTDGRRTGRQRQAGQARRSAARPGQSRGPRGRGLARGHRRQPGPSLRRVRGRGPRHREPPRRSGGRTRWRRCSWPPATR